MRYSAKTVFYWNKLYKRVKIGTYRALYRTAGLLRTASKRSMRLRPGPAKAGSPPHAHTANGLRVIEFAVLGNTAIVGPKKFPGSNFWSQPVTHMHEFGGDYISRKGVLAHYPERSYMGITLRRLMAKGKISREFRISIAEAL